MYFDVGNSDPDVIRMEVGWATELSIPLIKWAKMQSHAQAR